MSTESQRPRLPSPTLLRVFVGLKVVVGVYWLWVVKATLLPNQSSFEAILQLSAPAVVSIHFVQLLIYQRLFKARHRFWFHATHLLAFGAFHLFPLLLVARASPHRPSDTAP